MRLRPSIFSLSFLLSTFFFQRQSFETLFSWETAAEGSLSNWFHTKVSYQVDVVEDEGGFVHLAEDEKHLVVNELFVLFQVTVHMLFQLCTNLSKEM